MTRCPHPLRRVVRPQSRSHGGTAAPGWVSGHRATAPDWTASQRNSPDRAGARGSGRTRPTRERGRTPRAAALAALAAAFLSAGCGDPKDRWGHVWYVDGVGNWGFGVFEMVQGLQAAGYRGHVENFRWSVTLNPVIDQTFRVFARTGGARLSGLVRDQLRRHPEAPVDLVGLSAGTGVVIWAIEDLHPPYKVRNAVLLGSSLSYNYDLRKAQGNMTGRIINYYSSTDAILDGPMRMLGTIDGEFTDAAGYCGFKGPGSDRVRNIGWSAEYAALGWSGAHTDCTSEPFVRHEIARHIVTPAP